VLNIDNLGQGQPIPPETTIAGQPSSYSRLIDSLGVAGPEAAAILHDLRAITIPKVNTAIDKGQQAIAEIKEVSHRAAAMTTSLDGLLGDVKPDVRGTIANLNAITGSTKAKLPGILDHADTVVVKASTAMDNARTALEEAKAALGNAKDVTASAREMVAGNRGKVDAMIASLKATGENLKQGSAEVRHAPWRLLYKPHPGEVANEELFDAARQFADGAESVNDAATALRDAMQNPNVDREQLKKLMDQLDQAFGNFHDVEHKLWTAVKD
jgi:ABC-type transporter Mla subunit MlaD